MSESRWQVTAYVANTTTERAESSLSSRTSPKSSFSKVAESVFTTMVTSTTTSTLPTTTQPLNITPEYAIDFGYNLSEFTTIEEQSACHFHPSTENYIIIVAFTIIFALSVIGNALVVIVVVQQRAMRSITNLYLLNLAITDLMLSVVCMPPTLVSTVISCWMFGGFLCRLLAYLQPVVVTASAYTLAMIAIERYYAICRPLHSRVWQTRSHAIAMIALVWVVSIVSNFLMLFMYELSPYKMGDLVGLVCRPKFEPIINFAYQIYMTTVLLLIPLVIMTVLYGSMIVTLRKGMQMDAAAAQAEVSSIANIPADNSVDEVEDTKLSVVSRLRSTLREVTHTFPSSKRLKSPYCAPNSRLGTRRSDASSVGYPNGARSLRSTHSEKNTASRQRVIRMLLVVVIIFFCCWTPSYIWWLMLMAAESFPGHFIDPWNSELNTAITVLTYISSCTNPITYCFLNKKFRTAMLAAFGRKSKSAHRFPRVYMPASMASSAKPINRSVSTTSQMLNNAEQLMGGPTPQLRRNSSSLEPPPSNNNLTNDSPQLNGRLQSDCNGETFF